MKLLIMIGSLVTLIYADTAHGILQVNGVNTEYKEKEIFVSRMKDPKCLKVAVTPENIFGGNLAGRFVPRECKKEFVTSLGVVQPIKIDDEIKQWER